MTLCCPNHQARGIPDRESAFSIAKSSCCEVTIFYTMRAPSLGAIAARPRFPLRRGGFFHRPLATLRAPQLTNARPTKKNGALSRQMCPLSEKTPQLFSPLAPLPFSPSAIPRARRRARSHTHSASFRFLPSPHGDSRTTH